MINERLNGLEQSSQILDYIRITERPFERLSILEFFDSVDLRCGSIMFEMWVNNEHF